MKKKYIYIVLIGLLSFSSCSDFLNSEPILEITDENYYKTKADAEKALVGCYDGLQRIWSGGMAFPLLSEICSDNTFGGGGNVDGLGNQALDEFDIRRSPADQNLFLDNWETYYNAIYRCNLLLSKMEQIDWKGDTDARTSIEGQTRFIRAFLYFDMVRLWENIPLLTEPSAENLPQAPVDDVYKVIVEDLKWAADNLKVEAYSTGWAADNDGRATQWAAKSLLARVFMFYTGYYKKDDLVGLVSKSDALNGLEEVISKGGYSLVPKFASLFSASAAYLKTIDGTTEFAGKGNAETVFSVKYNYTSDYNGKVDGNHWLVMMGMRSVTSYPYAQGWGGCTVDADLWNAFSSSDRRKTASIIALENEGIESEIKDQREYTGYMNKKYTPRSIYNAKGELVSEAEELGGVNFMLGQFQDYVSIRYADVLLMAAELGSPNAQKYFDEVRKRAYESDFSSIPVNKDNLLKERRLEFAFEGIRYWDVLRQGIDAAASILSMSKTVMNGGVSVKKEIKAENILKTRGFQQIPIDQINMSNGVLKQNQGW